MKHRARRTSLSTALDQLLAIKIMRGDLAHRTLRLIDGHSEGGPMDQSRVRADHRRAAAGNRAAALRLRIRRG